VISTRETFCNIREDFPYLAANKARVLPVRLFQICNLGNSAEICHGESSMNQLITATTLNTM
jgi:hypothetical protein